MSFLQYSIEADSLDNQLELVQRELKLKNNLLEEKSALIQELRQQVEDRDRYIEELENCNELNKRDTDRLTKALNEKDEELEAVSRFSKELETRVDSQSRKLDARTDQVQKLYTELTKTKKDLVLVDELKHKIEILEAKQSVPRTARRENLVEHDEVVAKLKHDLKVAESSWQMERQQRERLSIENCRLENKADDLSKRVQELERKIELHQQRRNEAIVTNNENLRLPMADEQGEFMNSQPLKTNYNKCSIKRELESTEIPRVDTMALHRMRMERAQELERRNKLTKPLHQTSYPLELDLYDDDPSMECTKIKPETMIRKALSPCPVNIYQQQQQQQQQQQRVRRPVKKAEAFIVQ